MKTYLADGNKKVVLPNVKDKELSVIAIKPIVDKDIEVMLIDNTTKILYKNLNNDFTKNWIPNKIVWNKSTSNEFRYKIKATNLSNGETILFTNSKILVAVRNKGDTANKVEDYNRDIDLDYCSEEVDNMTIGVDRPINPITGKEMLRCINWRRMDFRGRLCKLIMTKDTRNSSMKKFCLKNPESEDCQCINSICSQPCLTGKIFAEENENKTQCGDKFCYTKYTWKNDEESFVECSVESQSHQYILVIILLAMLIFLLGYQLRLN